MEEIRHLAYEAQAGGTSQQYVRREREREKEREGERREGGREGGREGELERGKEIREGERAKINIYLTS